MTRAQLLALAGGALAIGGCGGGAGDEATAQSPATATAVVQRTTLITREAVDGTLGYADERPVLHRVDDSSGAGGGGVEAAGGGGEAASATVTWLPREGSTVRRGQALYRADGEPVRLLHGATPAYRALAVGVEGPDVAQLERNLVALGYEPGEIDGTFDTRTDAAVRTWQADAGWTVTGAVQLGQVVFLPGARRVGDIEVRRGELISPGAEIMTTTARERLVRVDLAADQQELADRGDRVTVTLPDGAELSGRIAFVGAVAQAPSGQEGQADEDSSAAEQATIEIEVRLAGDADTGRLDGAPVSVGLVDEVSRHVLAVPVTALLARPGGTYAVERRTADGVQRVGVEVGQFADGLVEVRGSGLREGDRVVIADDL